MRRRVNTPSPSFSALLRQGPAAAAGDGWDRLTLRARTPTPPLGRVTAVLEGGGGDGFFAEGIAGGIVDDASRATTVTRGPSVMVS